MTVQQSYHGLKHDHIILDEVVFHRYQELRLAAQRFVESEWGSQQGAAPGIKHALEDLGRSIERADLDREEDETHWMPAMSFAWRHGAQDAIAWYPDEAETIQQFLDGRDPYKSEASKRD